MKCVLLTNPRHCSIIGSSGLRPRCCQVRLRAIMAVTSAPTRCVLLLLMSMTTTVHSLRLFSRGAALRCALAAASAPLLPPQAARASLGQKTIGQIPASGIIFKDIVRVERFDDPKVDGVEVIAASLALSSHRRRVREPKI